MKGFDTKSIAKLGKMGLAAMNRNLPSILSGAAIAGLLATAWMTYKSAPKIKDALEDAKAEKDFDADVDEDESPVSAEKLTAWETFTAVAPHIWKPAACGIFTVGCIIGANVLNVQRLTMLAGAYKLSEKKLKEYEEKAKELLGEKQAEELHDTVAKSLRADADITGDEIISTDKGEEVFYDEFSGRLFRSSEATIRRAESILNKSVLCGEFVQLNDLYYELGLKGIKMGDAFGWRAFVNHSRTPYIDIRLTPDAQEINGEMRVVYIMSYNVDIDAENFHTRLC